MTKSKLNRIISLSCIALSILMVVIVAFSNSELTDAWQVLFTLDIRWVIGCIAGFAAYVFFDGLGIFSFLRQMGYRIGLASSVHLSFTGFYYANITPGSSGGQPMQVYLMAQRSIPVGIGTATMTVKLFATQLATVAITAGLWLANLDFCRQQLGGVRMVIILGWIINAAAVPLVLLVGYHRPLVEKVVHWFVRLFARWHWCRDPEKTIAKLDGVLESYHGSMALIRKHPWQVVLQVLIGMLEMLSLMAITVCVYHAFRLTDVHAIQLMTVAFMLFVSASYTPLPGASGAQEGGFLLFYRGLFTGGTLSMALLVWRFFTYYLFLILGALDALISVRKKPKQCAKVET